MSKRSQISITKFSFSLLIILFSSFSSFAQEIGILSTEKPIYEIEKNYLENKTDNIALRKYIDARQKAGIYNKLDQKGVTTQLDLRNNAAHGNYSEYDHKQVKMMYDFVFNFLSKHQIR